MGWGVSFFGIDSTISDIVSDVEREQPLTEEHVRMIEEAVREAEDAAEKAVDKVAEEVIEDANNGVFHTKEEIQEMMTKAAEEAASSVIERAIPIGKPEEAVEELEEELEEAKGAEELKKVSEEAEEKRKRGEAIPEEALKKAEEEAEKAKELEEELEEAEGEEELKKALEKAEEARKRGEAVPEEALEKAKEVEEEIERKKVEAEEKEREEAEKGKPVELEKHVFKPVEPSKWVSEGEKEEREKPEKGEPVELEEHVFKPVEPSKWVSEGKETEIEEHKEAKPEKSEPSKPSKPEKSEPSTSKPSKSSSSSSSSKSSSTSKPSKSSSSSSSSSSTSTLGSHFGQYYGYTIPKPYYSYYTYNKPAYPVYGYPVYGVVPLVVFTPAAAKLIAAGAASLASMYALDKADETFDIQEKIRVAFTIPEGAAYPGMEMPGAVEPTDEEIEIIAEEVTDALISAGIVDDIIKDCIDRGITDEEKIKEIVADVTNKRGVDEIDGAVDRAISKAPPKKQGRWWQIKLWIKENPAIATPMILGAVQSAIFLVIWQTQEWTTITQMAEKGKSDELESMFYTARAWEKDAEKALKEGNVEFAKECINGLTEALDDIEKYMEEHEVFKAAGEAELKRLRGKEKYFKDVLEHPEEHPEEAKAPKEAGVRGAKEEGYVRGEQADALEAMFYTARAEAEAAEEAMKYGKMDVAREQLDLLEQTLDGAEDYIRKGKGGEYIEAAEMEYDRLRSVQASLEETYDKSFVSYPTSGRVVKVVDGDTFVLESGETVRIKGIEAPEKGGTGPGPYYYTWAECKEELEKMILDETVELDIDPHNPRDSYGRLLAYVHMGGIDIGRYMVNTRYARQRGEMGPSEETVVEELIKKVLGGEELPDELSPAVKAQVEEGVKKEAPEGIMTEKGKEKIGEMLYDAALIVERADLALKYQYMDDAKKNIDELSSLLEDIEEYEAAIPEEQREELYRLRSEEARLKDEYNKILDIYGIRSGRY